MATRLIELVSAIHKRVREQAAFTAPPVVLEEWSHDLARLQSAYNALYCARNVVGTTPQLPASLLGWIAGRVIRVMQRLLFWYTPQIAQFHEAATSTLNRVCSLQEREFRAFLALANRVEALERETRLLKAAEGATQAEADVSILPREPYTRLPLDSRDFYFALQGRFQSREPSDVARLEMYRSIIGNLDPKLPEGPWVDLGCGRGDWLRVAGGSGHETIGVDSDRNAIQSCRESGYEATRSDALEYLRQADDHAFSVVTAFHFVEHCPFDYCLNLVYQAARALKPGGVLLLETPNPANLLMAAEQFWKDPTHHRPIPIPLMDFLLSYCGLTVVRCFEVNPREESEHLPLADLEPIQRLDRLLYGPQDYAMMGRVEP